MNVTHQKTSDTPYSDIIHLSRPIIKGHPPISRDLRAAQFAPYAALVGHRDLIQNVEDQNTFDEPEIILEYPEDYDFPEVD